MKTQVLPDKIVEQQRKAGRARQASMTPADRVALGKLAWRKRVEKYRQAATPVSARTLPT
jgi:hypothetical protein